MTGWPIRGLAPDSTRRWPRSYPRGRGEAALLALTFSPTVAVLLVLIGVAVGAFGTIVGSGGGFILTPLLLHLYPYDRPATITAISLTAVFFNAASGSAAYAHQRSVGGAQLGARLSLRASGRAVEALLGLALLLAARLVASAV